MRVPRRAHERGADMVGGAALGNGSAR